MGSEAWAPFVHLHLGALRCGADFAWVCFQGAGPTVSGIRACVEAAVAVAMVSNTASCSIATCRGGEQLRGVLIGLSRTAGSKQRSAGIQRGVSTSALPGGGPRRSSIELVRGVVVSE